MLQALSQQSSRRFRVHSSDASPCLSSASFTPLEALDFEVIDRSARDLADFIEDHFEQLADILLTYETFEVVRDEADRTIDLLRSLRENESYFKLRIGAACAFLPKNQPLYAFCCFVVVPSFMTSEVAFRIPATMRDFFSRMLDFLSVSKRFPNIVVSTQERLEFLRERSALRIDPVTQETWPVTEAVIFTGTSHHADQLRRVFDPRTLFIANGSGHNPIVVSSDADLHDAVDAVLTLQLYNQGQDCAAPNAILVHKKIAAQFTRYLHRALSKVRVGQYRDRTCRVGPISDAKDLVRIQELFCAHRSWIDPATPGILRTLDGIVEPTIVRKPLKEGGNFHEVFAPVIFLQEYERDADLSLYFQHPHYARHAMYITVYGHSSYVEGLIGRPIDGKVLHEPSSLLRNVHLHMRGIERGTRPYGGCGYSASNYSLHGNITCGATLPQREIYHCLARPFIDDSRQYKMFQQKATTVLFKDVQKLLRLQSSSSASSEGAGSATGIVYLDSHLLRQQACRYVPLDNRSSYSLLAQPNIDIISSLLPSDIHSIRAVRSQLMLSEQQSAENFRNWLYALVKDPSLSADDNRSRQKQFFILLYRLLFGKDSGPRLAQFLMEADRQVICSLLDV